MNRGRSRSAPGPGSTPQQVPVSPPAVHSITSAAQSHSDDMDARIKRYLVSMGLRTVCVILVLVIDSPIRWAFAVLAVVLPYIAVVMANAAGSRRRPPPPPVTSPSPQAPVSLAGVTLVESPATTDFSSQSNLRSDASSERTN